MAFGQTVDRGNEVTVNPVMGGGSGMLLYPGGQYMRVVHPALQPGETAHGYGRRSSFICRAKHRAVARKTAPSRRDAGRASAAPEPAPPPAPEANPAQPAKPKPKVQAASPAKWHGAAPPAPQAAYNPGFGDFGRRAPPVSIWAHGAAARAQPHRRPRAWRAPIRRPPAATTPPGAEAPTPGLTKRSVILFAPQAADPAESALGAIKFLAGDLNAAMTSRIGPHPDPGLWRQSRRQGSDARRLSLKRALAIRQVLIDDGVPAERIDVRAMGGADDRGPADRVDVLRQGVSHSNRCSPGLTLQADSSAYRHLALPARTS